jgi:predicted RNA binding protein YcfA (HicA-like mRNA interferase family)
VDGDGVRGEEEVTPSMKIRDMIKMVESDGWKIVRTKGSHRHYHHPSKRGIVTIAGHPSDDLDPGTQASILRQAGLKQAGLKI